MQDTPVGRLLDGQAPAHLQRPVRSVQSHVPNHPLAGPVDLPRVLALPPDAPRVGGGELMNRFKTVDNRKITRVLLGMGVGGFLALASLCYADDANAAPCDEAVAGPSCDERTTTTSDHQWPYGRVGGYVERGWFQ